MRPAIDAGDFNAALMNGYLNVFQEVANAYKLQIKANSRSSPRQRDVSSGWDSLPWWLKIVIGAGIALLLLIDWFVLGGFFTRLIFMFAASGRGGGGGWSGGGFGGGSGGGGGSSR